MVFFLFLSLPLFGGPPFPAPDAVSFPAISSQTVLVLNSYHWGYTWSDNEMDGIIETFRKKAPHVNLLIEHLDCKHLPGMEHFDEIRDVLRIKLKKFSLSLVMVADNPALDFAIKYRHELFRGIPIVFLGINGFNREMLRGESDIAGIPERLDVKRTLLAALRLVPGTAEIVFLHDYTSTGMSTLQETQEELFALQNLPKCTFWDELPIEEIISRVQRLSTGTILMSLSFSRDKAGKLFNHEEIARILGTHSPVPVFGLHEERLGHGIVGGCLMGGYLHGQLGAELGLRILSGTPATSFPLAMNPHGLFKYDYRQLEKYRLNPANLPADAQLINKPVPYYEKHHQIINISLVIILSLLAGIFVLVRNIMTRRVAEDQLRISEDKYRQVIENTSEGIAVVQDNQFVFLNPGICKIYGYSVDEMLHQEAFFAILPEDLPRMKETLDAWSKTQGTSVKDEYRIKRRDGKTAWVVLSSVGILWGGKPATLDFYSDISVRKAAEEEKRKLETQVLQAQKLESLGVLAGGIAHDFNNLLTAIMGNVELSLLDPSNSPAVRTKLRSALTTSQRAADLCRQMLAYSGKGRFVLENIDLNSLIEEMTQMLEVSISRKAGLKFAFAPELPKIEADATQIRQILMNLVINAAESVEGQNGLISISTRVQHCNKTFFAASWLKEKPPEGSYIMLEVTDNGCGMDEKTMARIFDPFFTTKFTGRGLGLGAVLGIVRGHRGALIVTSTRGKGSTFQVFLPTNIKAQAGAGEAGFSAAVTWKCSGTVLLVDDEADIRILGEDMLEKLGFSVLTAENGVRALEILAAKGRLVSAIILDLTMPKMGGEETLREVRKYYPEMFVFLSSGYNEVEVAERFSGQPFTGFLQKPYSFETLAEKLKILADRPAFPDTNGSPAA